MNKGKYTLEETQKQNKELSDPHDSVKLYMNLKKYGKIQYTYECTASSAKKGKTKLCLGILVQMYGEDKKWVELVHEMEQDIITERSKRGAGDKPVTQKFDPMYIVPGGGD